MKDSKFFSVTKLTEGSVEHLHPNPACLPPQHTAKSPITSCLKENRHFPQTGAFLVCVIQLAEWGITRKISHFAQFAYFHRA